MLWGDLYRENVFRSSSSSVFILLPSSVIMTRGNIDSFILLVLFITFRKKNCLTLFNFKIYHKNVVLKSKFEEFFLMRYLPNKDSSIILICSITESLFHSNIIRFAISLNLCLTIKSLISVMAVIKEFLTRNCPRKACSWGCQWVLQHHILKFSNDWMSF